jgi:hypothetical protein
VPLLEEERRRQCPNLAIANVMNDIHRSLLAGSVSPFGVSSSSSALKARHISTLLRPSIFHLSLSIFLLSLSTFHLPQNPTCADLPDTSSAYRPKSACSPIVFHTHTQTQDTGHRHRHICSAFANHMPSVQAFFKSEHPLPLSHPHPHQTKHNKAQHSTAQHITRNASQATNVHRDG